MTLLLSHTSFLGQDHLEEEASNLFNHISESIKMLRDGEELDCSRALGVEYTRPGLQTLLRDQRGTLSLCVLLCLFEKSGLNPNFEETSPLIPPTKIV